MAGLSCQEIIDEIQARTGRTGNTEDPALVTDNTRCTRWINEAQRFIVQQVPGIPSLYFNNRTSLDTTGTITYSITDLTIGDSTGHRYPCRVTQLWYLDGNDSVELDYIPPDDFNSQHPDPTHSDEAFGKPKRWTQFNNTEVVIYPYCDSGYWDKDLKFVGDFYPKDFTTDSTVASDISMSDELLIQYGIWQAWKAIGNTAEEFKAKKVWSNPEPLPGEDIGLLEKFRDSFTSMPAWSWNLMDD